MPPSQSIDPSFSIIIPLYNEEANVSLLINSIFREVSDLPSFLELVLIDDGSCDRTAELATSYATLEPRIRLRRHDRNRGLGAAIRTGMQTAQGDFILYTDADVPFDFSLIARLITLAGCDRMIAGYRLNRGEGLRRWVLSRGYNLLINAFFGLRARDVNFACKIIPRQISQKFDLRSEGSFIDVELILESERMGLTIEEVPLTYFPRTHGQSTLSTPRVILNILSEMTGYVLRAAVAVDGQVLAWGPSALKHRVALLLMGTANLFSNSVKRWSED